MTLVAKPSLYLPISDCCASAEGEARVNKTQRNCSGKRNGIEYQRVRIMEAHYPQQTNKQTHTYTHKNTDYLQYVPGKPCLVHQHILFVVQEHMKQRHVGLLPSLLCIDGAAHVKNHKVVMGLTFANIKAEKSPSIHIKLDNKLPSIKKKIISFVSIEAQSPIKFIKTHILSEVLMFIVVVIVS